MKTVLSFLAVALLCPVVATASGNLSSTGIEFLGQAVFATGHEFQNTVVGGLSGLAFDPSSGEYLSISDDKGLVNPARFYGLRIDLSDGHLHHGDVAFSYVVTLRQATGQLYQRRALDPEGIAIAPDGRIFICSEGNSRFSTAPWVAEFNASGQFVRELSVPEEFITTSDSTGFRDNANFESLSVSPSGKFLFTSVEHALKEDGPLPDTRTTSRARIVKYDLREDRVVMQFFYEIDRVILEPGKSGLYGQNGLVELIAVDDFVLLVLERSYVPGIGNRIRLFRTDSRHARDVSNHDGRTKAAVVPKQLVFDLDSLNLKLDNFEGMAFGPILPDGRRTLVMVSDNNFNESQRTLFFAFAFGGQADK